MVETSHSALYTLHSTLQTLHSTLYTPHSALHTLHSTLYTPHTTRCTPHFPHSTRTLHTLHSTFLHIPQSTLHWYGSRGKKTQNCSNALFHIVSQKCSAWLHSGWWAASCFFLPQRYSSPGPLNSLLDGWLREVCFSASGTFRYSSGKGCCKFPLHNIHTHTHQN